MKNVILVMLVLFSAAAGFAQAKKGTKGGPKFTPEQRAQKSVDNLDKTVSLSADQKTQVYNLALSRAQKVDGIREKYKGQPDQKETAKAEMKAAHKEYRQAVKPLLTQEQLDKLKAKHKANKGGKGPKGGKGGKGVKNKPDETISETDLEELIPSEEE